MDTESKGRRGHERDEREGDGKIERESRDRGRNRKSLN